MPRRKDPRKLAQDTAVAAVWLPRDQLTRWDRNPRKHTERSLAVTRRSIERFGFVSPIIVWTSKDRMVAGHGRLKSYDALVAEHGSEWAPKHAPGPGLVPVRFMEFDGEEEANAYALVDNRASDLSEWDAEALDAVVKEFDEIDLGDLGWDEEERSSFHVEVLESDLAFGALSQGEPDVVQMTFTLTPKQRDTVSEAMRVAQDGATPEGNRNGWALHEIATAYLGGS